MPYLILRTNFGGSDPYIQSARISLLQDVLEVFSMNSWSNWTLNDTVLESARHEYSKTPPTLELVDESQKYVFIGSD